MSYKERYRGVGELSRDKLDLREAFWRDYQPFLLEHGYQLRRRFHPDWVPSWKTRKESYSAEDGRRLPYSQLMDATRVSDGSLVALKLSDCDDDPDEVAIACFFSSESIADDSRNHCVPVYETISLPDLEDVMILVMPLVYPLESPQFHTVGETVECFRQLFEGVQFMHENNIAHGDLKSNNFMVDSKGLFRSLDDQPHPSNPTLRRDYQGPPCSILTRTHRPVKYYIIDFNLSRRYTGPGPHLRSPSWGGDKTVPEMFQGEACDPFAVDIYCLGNTIRQEFSEGGDLGPGKKGFGFMKRLVDDMCQEDPNARPKADQVVARFDKIRLALSERKLRSRIASKDENFVMAAVQFVFHWSGQVMPILRRIPAIPSC
ncbi:kinase-like domain-containing protein [Mycena filopes]|nr:kinase-like domain-containing protein [Mycena filopes]